MAFQSAFKERFEGMESTRNRRLNLLQAEKDLQKNKSLLLSAKLANLRLLERRCLILDHKLACDNFKVSFLKSEIEFLDRNYQKGCQQLRCLKVEVEELEKLEKERDDLYWRKWSEMEKFRDETRKFAAEIRTKVVELRRRRDEKSNVQNPDMQAAKDRKLELLALKEKVACNLESNKRARVDLQKQLESLR